MNMPPKNMTSVTRNVHIPRVDASFCWPAFSKWCRTATALLCDDNWLCPLTCCVVLGFRGHNRCNCEIFGSRRRIGLPLEPGCTPGIRAGERAVLHWESEMT